jgi:hypothetical protein
VRVNAPQSVNAQEMSPENCPPLEGGPTFLMSRGGNNATASTLDPTQTRHAEFISASNTGEICMTVENITLLAGRVRVNAPYRTTLLS